MATIRYRGLTLGALTCLLVHMLGCGDDSRAGAIDPSTGSGGSAGAGDVEEGGAAGADSGPAQGDLVPFECSGSIPSGLTMYLDEHGYWRVGPNDPAGSYCEGGDLVFYGDGFVGSPVYYGRQQEQVEYLGTALEVTGCNTVVARIEIDPYAPDMMITDLDALAPLVNVRYGALVVDVQDKITNVNGLANVMLIDQHVNIMGMTEESWVESRLDLVDQQETYPDPTFTCPIEPDPEHNYFDPEKVYITGSSARCPPLFE